MARADVTGIGDALTVNVEGIREIERHLKRMSFKYSREIVREALWQGASPVLKRAKELVPVREGKAGGTLKKTLHRARQRKRRIWDTENVFIKHRKPGAYYAHLVEFGTRHSEPRPYMIPATKQTQGSARRIMVDHLRKELKIFHAPNLVTSHGD